MTEPAIVQGIALILVIASTPGVISLFLLFRGLARRVSSLESLRLLDAADRGRLQHRVEELERGIGILIAQIRRAGMTPEWTPSAAPPTPMTPGGQHWETEMLVDLWQRIEAQFSMEEIHDLAFELGLPESHALTAGTQARELVSAANRTKRLEQLRSIARRDRPNGGF